MKRLLLALAIVLVASSSAVAGWGYVVGPGVYPGPVVTGYWPGEPVYSYSYYPAAPVVVPGPVVYPAPAFYPGPVIVRPRVFIPGQPVRNAVRATLW